jgi:putative membrane protein
MSDPREELAEERTDWAEDRTILANERTFASWVGAGMGAVGVALALRAVFGAVEPKWAAKVVASTFLAISLLIYWLAAFKAHKTHKRLSSGDAEVTPTRNFHLLAGALTLGTLAVGVILWRL